MELASNVVIVLSVTLAVAFVNWIFSLTKRNKELEEKNLFNSVEDLGNKIAQKIDERIALIPRPLTEDIRRNEETSLFFSVFTEREIQIGQLIVTGITNKEVAEKLGTSPSTVNNQIENMRKKCGAKNKAGLVSYLLEHELV